MSEDEKKDAPELIPEATTDNAESSQADATETDDSEDACAPDAPEREGREDPVEASEDVTPEAAEADAENGGSEHNAAQPFGSEAEPADSDKKNKIAALLKNRRAVYMVVALTAVIAVVWMLFATHIVCFHENWANATCEEARHCVDCGKTEGEPLGHEWIDATCTEPKTCMRCGKTEGQANGHKTEGWSEPVVNILSAEEKSALKCTVCGEAVDTKTSTVKSFIRDGKFIFSPSDFCKRLRTEWDMEAIDGGDSDMISYALVKSMTNREMCAMLSFSSMDGETNLGEDCKYDSSCNPSPLFMVDTEKCNSAEALVAFIMTCDPSLTRSDAKAVATALASSTTGNNGTTEKNGIEYRIVGVDYRVLFRASVK